MGIEINLGSFLPNKSNDLKLLELAYGMSGLCYSGVLHEGNSRRIRNEGRLRLRIQREFFHRISAEIGSEFGHDLYVKALKDAVEIHQFIIETLDLPIMQASLLNDVNSISDDPNQRLKLLSMPDNRIDPLLRFQLKEQLILAFLVAGIDIRTRDTKLRSQLGVLNDAINKHFFTNEPLGKTEQLAVYSTHHCHTNQVHEISPHPFSHKSNNETERETLLRVREATIFGKKTSMVVDIRKKRDPAAVLKALDKANGNVSLDDVTDMIGIKVIVVDGNRDTVLAQFKEMLINDIDEVSIEDDDATGSTRGQSQRHRFRRFNAYVGNAKCELLFYTLREYLNSIYDVGSKDNNGWYDGASHQIYELRRVIRVAEQLFPQYLYGLDICHYGKKKMEEIANQLLNKK